MELPITWHIKRLALTITISTCCPNTSDIIRLNPLQVATDKESVTNAERETERRNTQQHVYNFVYPDGRFNADVVCDAYAKKDQKNPRVSLSKGA
jgi:hypothetical protein